MTTIEEKLLAFVEHRSFDLVSLDATRARSLGVRLHRSYWGRVWVEEHGVMTSPLVFKGKHPFIGQHSYMNDGGYIKGAVFIGRYCSIGRRVSIGASGHPATGLSTSPAVREDNSVPYTDSELMELFEPVRKARRAVTIVENDVWICDGAIVLEGVRLGTGCIVGANAVVTSDVEPYSVVAGLPAAPVKSRFSEAIVTRLLKSRWWNLPIAYLRALPVSHILRTLEHLEAGRPQDDGFRTFAVTEPEKAAS